MSDDCALTRAAGLIDVHTHFVPRRFPASPVGCTCWPSMRSGADGAPLIHMGSQPFRQLDLRAFDRQARLSSMDAEGIAIQVLSPMPELLAYWMTPADALSLARHVNGDVAEMIANGGGRFLGLATVPMQDPAMATRELARVKEDGFLGVELGSNVVGKGLGDPVFAEFYAEAERLDLALFVHALHPAGADRLAAFPDLVPFAAFPLDTALAAASLLRAGVPVRHPHLRIAFSHGGGALPAILSRLNRGWELSDGFGGTLPESPGFYASRFYYDTLVYDPAWLSILLRDFAPGQFFAGTDYPFAIAQEGLKDFLAAARPDPADPVYHTTARRFLGIGA